MGQLEQNLSIRKHCNALSRARRYIIHERPGFDKSCSGRLMTLSEKFELVRNIFE